MAKKDETATPPPVASKPEPATHGESRVCANLDEARQAIDELGYPVMVGPNVNELTVHEKKVAALAAVDAVGGKCIVARPKFV